MAIEVSDEDIVFAEDLLLPDGCYFDKERREFIRSMESRDVVACPGSGKTTALLAKLLILARKMPFEDGRGICLLTHTNVAMAVIKARAGAAADSLFRYPNFFGTIQSFVDAFLAGPWFRAEFSRPIHSIDDDIFLARMRRRYNYYRSRLQWLEQRGGVERLAGFWLRPGDLSVGETLVAPIKGLSEETPTYALMNKIRGEILAEGILSYNDAYSLALRYLARKPEVARAMVRRFAMVFVDEVQDTDEHQFKVLDALFCSGDTLVQRVGDPNQAIFHSDNHGDYRWQPRNSLHISDTQRYGTSITNLLTSVRHDDEVLLRPCETKASHPNHIIVFSQGEEPDVLSAFAVLIERLGINQASQRPVKAAGWIGKDNTEIGKLCIKYYLPTFEKLARSPNKRFSNLLSYSAAAVQNAMVIGPKGFLDVVVHAITHALDIAGVKNEITGRAHTHSSVQEHLQNKHPATWLDTRIFIAACYLGAVNGTVRAQDLYEHIKASIKSAWDLHDDQVNSFLESDVMDAPLSPEATILANQFVSDNGLVIDVGTVHSIKGETHAATLYLETSYYGQTDGQRLIEFLKGKRPSNELKKARHIQNLKVAHVAFSRPTDLLAFACRAESIAGHEAELANNGWAILTVPELLGRNGEARNEYRGPNFELAAILNVIG